MSRIAAQAGVTERVRPMFGSDCENGVVFADAPNGCSVPIANGVAAGLGVCAPAPAATNAIATAATDEATALSMGDEFRKAASASSGTRAAMNRADLLRGAPLACGALALSGGAIVTPADAAPNPADAELD